MAMPSYPVPQNGIVYKIRLGESFNKAKNTTQKNLGMNSNVKNKQQLNTYLSLHCKKKTKTKNYAPLEFIF